MLVVQECEDPAHIGKGYADWAGAYVWAGSRPSKGIGVFARNGRTIERLGWKDRGLAQFLPVRIDDRLDLLGVWTQAVVPSTYSYIGQFWQYLRLHRKALGADTVICGDFNSNSIWDRKRRKWNHSACVAQLDKAGFTSLYHLTANEPQGAESRPTFYHYRNPEKPYHLDYVFAHRERLPDGWAGLSVGDPAEWLDLSDHMPVVVDL